MLLIYYFNKSSGRKPQDPRLRTVSNSASRDPICDIDIVLFLTPLSKSKANTLDHGPRTVHGVFERISLHIFETLLLFGKSRDDC